MGKTMGKTEPSVEGGQPCPRDRALPAGHGRQPRAASPEGANCFGPAGLSPVSTISDDEPASAGALVWSLLICPDVSEAGSVLGDLGAVSRGDGRGVGTHAGLRVYSSSRPA